MPSLLRDFFKKQSEAEEIALELKKANEMFCEKPFVKEFKEIKKFTQKSSYFFAFFSICTGFVFLYTSGVQMFGMVLTTIFALGGLLWLEDVKHKIASKFFEKIYINFGFLELVLLFFFLLFFGGSVALSVAGAGALYKEIDKKETEFVKDTQTKERAISQKFDSKIKNLELELQKAQDVYRQNIYSTASQKQILYYQNQIENLNKEKTKELAKIEKTSNANLSEIKKESGFNLVFWLILSLCNECILICCLWFQIYYAYKSDKEKNVLENIQTFELSKNNLATLLDMFLGTQSNAMPSTLNAITTAYEPKKEPGNNIGFSIKNDMHGSKNEQTHEASTLVTTHEASTCLHCGSSYQKRIKTQKYCKEQCRVTAWELRTNKKLYKK